MWCALALLGALSGCATAAQRAERALDRGALHEAAAWLERAPGSFERSMIGADLALAREDVEAARRALEEAPPPSPERPEESEARALRLWALGVATEDPEPLVEAWLLASDEARGAYEASASLWVEATRAMSRQHIRESRALARRALDDADDAERAALEAAVDLALYRLLLRATPREQAEEVAAWSPVLGDSFVLRKHSAIATLEGHPRPGMEETLTALTSGDIALLDALAFEFAARGAHRSAATAYDLLAEREPSSAVRAQLEAARLYYLLSNPAAARTRLERAILEDGGAFTTLTQALAISERRGDEAFARALTGQALEGRSCDGRHDALLVDLEVRRAREEVAALDFRAVEQRFHARLAEGCDVAEVAPVAARLLADAGATAEALGFYDIALQTGRMNLDVLADALRVAERVDDDARARAFVNAHLSGDRALTDGDLRDTLALLRASPVDEIRAEALALLERSFARDPGNGYIARRLGDELSEDEERQTIYTLHIAAAEDPWVARARTARWQLESGVISAALIRSLEALTEDSVAATRDAPFVYRGGQTLEEVAWLMLVDTHLERGEPARALEAARSFVSRRGEGDPSAWRVLWQHRTLRAALPAEDAAWLYRTSYDAGLRARGLSLEHGLALLDLNALAMAEQVLARAVASDGEPFDQVVRALIERGATAHALGVLESAAATDPRRHLWEARVWMAARNDLPELPRLSFAIGASTIAPGDAERVGYIAQADDALMRALEHGATEAEVGEVRGDTIVPQTLCRLFPLARELSDPDAVPGLDALQAHVHVHGWDEDANLAADRLLRSAALSSLVELFDGIDRFSSQPRAGTWTAQALERDDLDAFERVFLFEVLGESLQRGIVAPETIPLQTLRRAWPEPNQPVSAVTDDQCVALNASMQAGWTLRDGALLYEAARASMRFCRGPDAIPARMLGYELSRGQAPPPELLDAWMEEHGPTQERWAAWAVRLDALRVPPAWVAHAAIRAAELNPTRPHLAALAARQLLMAGDPIGAGVWTERALGGDEAQPDPATSIELANAWLAAGDAARAEDILRAASRADTRASSLARLRLATLERLRGSHAATRVALEGSRSLRPVGLEYAAAFEHPELLSRPLVARATDALDRSSPRDAEAILSTQLGALLERGEFGPLRALLSLARSDSDAASMERMWAALSRQRGHTQAAARRLESLAASARGTSERLELAAVYARGGDRARAERVLRPVARDSDPEAQRALTQWWALFGTTEEALDWSVSLPHPSHALERARLALSLGRDPEASGHARDVALLRAGRADEIPDTTRPSIALAAGAPPPSSAGWVPQYELICAAQPACGLVGAPRTHRGALAWSILRGGTPPSPGALRDPHEQAVAITLGALGEMPSRAIIPARGQRRASPVDTFETLSALLGRRDDAPVDVAALLLRDRPSWNVHVDRAIAAEDARARSVLVPGSTGMAFRAALLTGEPVEQAEEWVREVDCHPAAVALLVDEARHANADAWSLALLRATERCADVGPPLAIHAAEAAARVAPGEIGRWSTLALERAYDPVSVSEAIAERLSPYPAASAAIDALCTARIALGEGSARHHLYRGVARARLGDAQGARADLDRYVQQSAALATGLPLAIRALASAGFHEDAIAYAEQLAELRWIHFDDTLRARQSAGLERALYALTEAPRAGLDLLARRFPGVLRDPVLAELAAPVAALHEQAGDVDVAIAIYRRAILDRPDDAVLRNNLAWTLARHGGDLDEALEHARAAVWLSGAQAPAFLDTLAWTHFLRGEAEVALGWQLLALRTLGPDARGPTDESEAIYYEHLAEIRAALATEPSLDERPRRRGRRRS